MLDSPSFLPGPQHLNTTGCVIGTTEGKGRGVYASKSIPRSTTVEISPVLLFSKQEYEEHAKYTVLDQYTFTWPDGRMALALGLGSLFNHSDSPNISFTLNTSTDSIRYTTTRDINPGEELCIFYGHELWFSPAEASEKHNVTGSSFIDHYDGFGSLSTLDHNELSSPSGNPFEGGDTTELILEDDLPFVRYKRPSEEEEPEAVRTIQAWVVDVADQRLITALLKWLKKVNLDTSELGHLKRVRRQNSTTTFLLADQTTFPNSAPKLPEDFDLPPPYLQAVPASSALTPTQLILKTALWPTLYTPRRKDGQEIWSRGRAAWAWRAMRRTVQAAIKAGNDGEYPIAAHVPVPYEEAPSMGNVEQEAPREFTAHDMRKSTNHPLRHAVINTIRQVADYATPAVSTDNGESVSLLSQGEDSTGVIPPQNGSRYLLTSLTLFTTHEPCVMCSMAVLHSRVKEVIYLYPMAQTGACGGVTCLPMLKGVNHRYSICEWKQNAKEDVIGSIAGRGISGHVVGADNTEGGGILDIATTMDA